MKNFVPDDFEELLGPEPVQPEPEPEPIVMMTMDEMRARDPLQPWTYAEYKRIPKTPYLIGDDQRPVLIARGLWCSFGLYKSGKTYVSLEEAFCIAAEVEFNGLPTVQGRVAYVCAEGDPQRIIARVVALCAKHGKEPDDILSPLKLNLIMSPINLLVGDGPKSYKTLIKRLDDGLGDYQAIWLDTWAKMLAAHGGNDTDADSVMPAIAGCDKIRAALGCAVIIVAHVGLSEKAQDRPKGLSDLPGAVDGGTLCVKDGEGPDAVFTFSARMQRYAADDYAFTANIEGTSPENTVLIFQTPQQYASSKLKAAQASMLAIGRALGAGCTVDAWRDAVITADIWRVRKTGKPPANPRQKWADELAKLVTAGWVDISGSEVVFNATPNGGTAGTDAEDEFDEE